MDPMNASLRAGLALALILPLAACQKPSDAAFGDKVRTYLLAHPELLEEMSVKLQQKKELAAAEAAAGAIKANRQALEHDSRDFVANPGGKFTVVEFFDYRCGYCKAAAPEVLKIIAANPDVRFVFKEFPIFGGPSDLAAKVALTVPGKAKGLELYKRFMSDASLDEAAVNRHLLEVGIDPEGAKLAGDAPEVARQLADVHDLARKLNIEGTPAFIVGDKLIPGANLPELNAAIAEVRTGKLKTLNGAAQGD